MRRHSPYRARFLAQEAIAVISLIGIGLLIFVLFPPIYEAMTQGTIEIGWVRK